MSLILTTPAALEEYNNRVIDAMEKVDESIENQIENENYTEVLDLSKKWARLDDLLFEIKIALRNPKLNIHVSIDTSLIHNLVSPI